MKATPCSAGQVRKLGVREGMALFVHCSLKAVDAKLRAEDMISALRSAVGESGTILMLTSTARDEFVFDPGNTPSTLGIVSEVFRKIPGTLRSLHPRHPVAASGALASELLESHEKAAGPCGRGTPFAKHAALGGYVLLIGVDLDTLTLLHTAEAELDLPYLTEMKGSYLDGAGEVHEVSMRQVPGGHRGGVRLFEKIFNERGLIRYGRLGNARTMLMKAGPVLDTMIEILRGNPAAALCPHDHCPDCVHRKGMIRAKQLAELGAAISLVVPELPEDQGAYRQMLMRFGIAPRFGLRGDMPIICVEAGAVPPPPPDDSGNWAVMPHPADLVGMRKPPPGYRGFAYSPLAAAQAGIQPFYGVLYKAPCRDSITDIMVKDGITNLRGCSSPRLDYLEELVPDGRVPLGSGHAQLREIVSAMRMRGFRGNYHLIVPESANLYATSMRMLKEFWDLLPGVAG